MDDSKVNFSSIIVKFLVRMKLFNHVLTMLIIPVWLTIFSLPLYAAINDQSQIDNPFGPLYKFQNSLNKIGITYERTGNNIVITMDEQKIMDAMPILESQGIVSKTDLNVINIAPISVSVVIVGISSAMTILNSVFERNEHLDKVNVQGYIIPIGETTKNPCYSFEYDRKNFMMLDLSMLTPRKFIRMTPNFIFNDWCKQSIDIEATNLS